MKLNELRAKRAEVISQAQAIMDAADTEGRELTADEMTAIDALIGVEDGSVPNAIANFDAQITRYQRQENLVADLAKPAGKPAIKPQPGQQTMKRADFNGLKPADQSAFVRNGGKITD
jgi:hypothetical protein